MVDICLSFRKSAISKHVIAKELIPVRTFNQSATSNFAGGF